MNPVDEYRDELFGVLDLLGRSVEYSCADMAIDVRRCRGIEGMPEDDAVELLAEAVTLVRCAIQDVETTLTDIRYAIYKLA